MLISSFPPNQTDNRLFGAPRSSITCVQMTHAQMKWLVLLAIVGYATAINLIGRTQSAAARGRLTCNGKPAAGVRVKLYDSDNSFLPGVLDTDDLMASGKTDSNGEYNLSGSTKEITGIEPYIAIYHDCNDGIKVKDAFLFQKG
ncbi:hypothetical protein Y032_0108g30 [Ancylostoma ceylanicum]|uniref:Transthyretin-like family protein n=1 Tax=Ancylostoma ceylanicum TaxID=53326 RepID=A0A016TF64_9BILA|nr:hypothetical protein Y032_0108g30 [Ancylostoma ceylanicum]